MDDRLLGRIDALIDVLDRIEKRLGQLVSQPPVPVAGPAPSGDSGLRGVVRLWAQERALAVSAADVDSLLDACGWDAKRLAAELQRLARMQSSHPVRTLRRLLQNR